MSGYRGVIRHTMPYTLSEFLRKQRCTEKFIKNFYEYLRNIYLTDRPNKTKLYKNTFFAKRIIYTYKKSNAIRYAFNWLKSKEGLEFWVNIAKKYDNYLEQIR